MGRGTRAVSRKRSCLREVFLWKQSPGGGEKLGSQSRTPNWGRRTRTQEGLQERKRSGTPGQEKERGKRLHPRTEKGTRIGRTLGKDKEEGSLRPSAKESDCGAGTRLKEGDRRGWDPVQEKKREVWELRLRGRSEAGKRPGASPPREASGCRRAGLRFRVNGGRRKAEAGGLAGERFGTGWGRLAGGPAETRPSRRPRRGAALLPGPVSASPRLAPLLEPTPDTAPAAAD